jgi:hypothetical protein
MVDLHYSYEITNEKIPPLSKFQEGLHDFHQHMQVPITNVCHKVGPSLPINNIIFTYNHKNRLDI